MKRYKVAIEETIVQEFELIAENSNEALDLAREKYCKSELVLESGEVHNRQMAIVEPYRKDEIEWLTF